MAEVVSERAPTTTDAPTTDPQVHLLDTRADGYCDPVTGLCMLPGATAEPTDQPADETTPVANPVHTQ